MDYKGRDSLATLVETGSVKLISPDYLISLDESNSTLPKRQDAPQNAFTSLPDDLSQVLVVLYPKLSPDHPDPKGFHLRRVAGYLRACKSSESAPTISAVMWDYLSLVQRPRDAKQEALYRMAANTAEIWYGHSELRVLYLREIPSDAPNNTPLSERGWTFFEEQVAALACKFERTDFPVIGDGEAFVGSQPIDAIVEIGKAKPPLPAPLVPAEFIQQLEAKKFKTKNDKLQLAAVYDRFFSQLMREKREFDFCCQATDATIGSFCAFLKDAKAALPEDMHIESLDFQNSAIGDDSAALLLHTLVAAGLSQDVQYLDLSYSRLGDTGCLSVAKALKHRDLQAQEGAPGPWAALRGLAINGCFVDDAACAALFASLLGCPKLESLGVQTQYCKHLTAALWKAKAAQELAKRGALSPALLPERSGEAEGGFSEAEAGAMQQLITVCHRDRSHGVMTPDETPYGDGETFYCFECETQKQRNAFHCKACGNYDVCAECMKVSTVQLGDGRKSVFYGRSSMKMGAVFDSATGEAYYGHVTSEGVPTGHGTLWKSDGTWFEGYFSSGTPTEATVNGSFAPPPPPKPVEKPVVVEAPKAVEAPKEVAKPAETQHPSKCCTIM